MCAFAVCNFNNYRVYDVMNLCKYDLLIHVCLCEVFGLNNYLLRGIK